MTVDDVLAKAAARLSAAGIETAALDAELLLRHVLSWDRATVVVRGREALPADALARLEALVAERERRRPLQHLTGIQAFWRHEFRVTPDVLVPRPETEILVHVALEAIRGRVRPVVVDVGTGSGCIAVSIAAERPDARVHAVDLSTAALAVARENADRIVGPDRVMFHEGDLLAPVHHLAGGVDLVVSNPPYVSADELAGLAPEVRDQDPRLALVPPEGVPALFARLFAAAADVIRPGGAVAVELGAGQETMVRATAEAAGLRMGRLASDLQDIPRVLLAVRAA